MCTFVYRHFYGFNCSFSVNTEGYSMCVSGPFSPHVWVLVTYLCCFVLLDIYFSSHVIYFL